eukprot:TRINITY_DN895_c0_g1_i3.p1 TRINITY_DN895_c0_g1~~TRINITY_DN895_c0_g1_i3.p1  ORF type:complete len:972 (+),score=222.12 TRINITY_DN895_c0_g1_i3:2547-5462(+)
MSSEDEVVTLQRYIRGYNSIVLHNQRKNQNWKRTHLAQELLQTESTYREALEMIVEVYQKPLVEFSNSSDPFVTMNDIRGIFSSVEVIMGVTQVVHSELKDVVSSWSSCSLIGPIFLRLKNVFRWYQSYCSNYTQVHNRLKLLKANVPKFKEFIDKSEKDPRCKGEDLESSLIRVVQRIPQYNMLLGDMFKNTWKEHPDYTNLQQAVLEMHLTGQIVNEFIREFESISMVSDLGLRLEGFQGLAVPARRHIYNFSVNQVSDTDGTIVPRHIFLFNDLLILASLLKETKVNVQPNTPQKKNLSKSQNNNTNAIAQTPSSSSSSPVLHSQQQRYECQLFTYLLNYKGKPNLELIDVNGQNFKLRIKTTVVCLSVKKRIDIETFTTKLQNALQLAIETFDRDSNTGPSRKIKGLSNNLNIPMPGGVQSTSPRKSNKKQPSINALPPALSSGSLVSVNNILNDGFDEEGKKLAQSIIFQTEIKSYIEKSEGLINTTLEDSFFWAAPVDIHDRSSKHKLQFSTHSNNNNNDNKQIIHKLVSATLVIGTYRVYLVNGSKNNVIFDKHIFELVGIQSKNYSEFQITFEPGDLVSGISQKSEEIINNLRQMYHMHFPGNTSSLHVQVFPDTRLKKLIEYTPLEMESTCQGFVYTYKCLCNYFKNDPRRDIIWDIHHIFAKQRIDALDLRRFQLPLQLDDIRNIYYSTLYSPQFTSIIVNIQPTKDYFNFLVNVIRKSKFIKKLIICSVDISRENIILLSNSIKENKELPLTSIDLSNTFIDEKGAAALGQSLKNLKDLEVLILDNSAIKYAPNDYLHSISSNHEKQLVTLSLAGTTLNAQSIDLLCEILKHNKVGNSLSTLNLSGVKVHKADVMKLFTTLNQDCLYSITHLDLSGFPLAPTPNSFYSLAVFLSCSYVIKHLNISDTNMSGKQFIEILKKLEGNNSLSGVVIEAAVCHDSFIIITTTYTNNHQPSLTLNQ